MNHPGVLTRRLGAALLCTVMAATGPWAGAPDVAPLSLKGFASGIHHWRNIKDQSRFIQAQPDQPSYAAKQMREIAANILLFQRSNGGWPKDYDMTAVLTAEQRAMVVSTRERTDTSYDNGNIHSQVDYLAQAFAREGRAEWRAACERGLDFILRSQYPNGGFPQRYPKPSGYHAHVTLNDGVTLGALRLLRDAGRPAEHFSWLNATRRESAREAANRGIECLLRSQIRSNGVLTGWCQQHDERTLEPRAGRTFELASNCPQETVEAVRYLMDETAPDARTSAAIEAAVLWLRTVRLTGTRVERVKAPREVFLRHTADFDVVVTHDLAAEPIWARHYEIGTNQPVFAGRDGVRKYALADIERERRTGTPWYGRWPAPLLMTDYPRWKARTVKRRVRNSGNGPNQPD